MASVAPLNLVSAEAERSAAKKWTTLALLAIAALIGFVDRVNISAALAVPAFKDHFALSDIDRGWINSAFFWSYAIFQIPMGYVVDRYGVKWTYAACFFLWCLASAAIGLVTTVWALVVMRLLVGAAESVVVPATYRWIRNNFHPNDSGTAIGFYMLGAKFGPAIGAPLAAWLIVAVDWHLMFVITGLAGLVWLGPWLLLARSDIPRDASGAIMKKQAVDVSLMSILSNRLVWGTLVVIFCYNYFTFFCMTWMPAYLVEARGLSLEEMGLYTFFSFLGIALVALASGWACDALIRRYGRAILFRKIFVVSGFAVASTVLLGARAGSVNEALFWNVFSLSGLGLTTANNLALSSITLIPAPIVGRVKGVQNVATALAGAAAPLITGWLLHSTGSFLAPITLIFALLILGGLTVIFVLRPEWAPRVPETGADDTRDLAHG
jgi:ACS family D-galactonate transporter-like MFS transporter